MAEQSLLPVEVIESPHGIKVPIGPHLGPGHRTRIARGCYEGAEIICAKRVIKSDDRVLECGAGVGIVSAVAAVRCRPQAILSFEANPQLIGPIEELHRLNDLQHVIEVRNQVLWSGKERKETVKFNVRGNFLGSKLSQTARRGEILEVATVDYEAIRSEFRPTVIMMDIEGGELDFLLNADLAGIRALVVEFHPNIYGFSMMQELKGLLINLGFDHLKCSTRTVWAAVRAVPHIEA